MKNGTARWLIGLSVALSACDEPSSCDESGCRGPDAKAEAGAAQASAEDSTPATPIDSASAPVDSSYSPPLTSSAPLVDAGDPSPAVSEPEMTEMEVTSSDQSDPTSDPISGSADAGAIDIEDAGADADAGHASTSDAAVEAGVQVDAGPKECDGTTTRPCAGVLGKCVEGVETCEDGKWSACSIQATDEDRCDIPGDDSNCDDTPNGGCACVDGEEQDCGSLTDVGECAIGTSTCGSQMWSECVGAQAPATRNCASANDYDCDGTPDDTIDDACKCEVDAVNECGEEPGSFGCRLGISTCKPGNGGSTSDWDDCEYDNAPNATPCDDGDAASSNDACSNGVCIGEYDELKPSVQSVTPAASAVDVQPESTVVVTFSEAMNQATITTSSFLVTGPEGSVAGTISFPSDTQAQFTPTTPLGLLRGYDISVATSVKDLAGNPLDQTKNSSFVTRDGAWGSATLLESDNTSSSTEPRLAVSANGDAVAIWLYGEDVVMNRYKNGSWGGVSTVQQDVNIARVGIDANGAGMVAWINGDAALGYRPFTRDALSSAQELDDQVYSVLNLGFAVSPQGKALINWSDDDYQVVSRYFDGSSWSTATDIDGAFQSAYYTSLGDREILFASDGSALAGWYDIEDSNATKTTKFTPGSGFANSSGAVGPASDSHVEFAGDPATTALAVWAEGDDIYGNKFTGGSWAYAAPLDTKAGAAAAPDVAMSPGGEGIAVWEQLESSHVNIYQLRYSGGAWVGNPSTIETSNADAAGPKVAMDRGNNGLALWCQNDPQSLYVARYNAKAGTWSGGVNPIESGSGAVSQPQMGIDDRGRAIVVWTQANGQRTDIYYNRFQ